MRPTNGKNWIVSLCLWLLIGGSFIFLLVLQYERMFRPQQVPASGIRGWAQEAVDFYNAAAVAIKDEARRGKLGSIRIHAEQNTSEYHCSSPCNKDLAYALWKIIPDAERDTLKVVYWDEPVSVGVASDGLLKMWKWIAPAWNGTLGRLLGGWATLRRYGWYQLGADGAAVAATESTDQQPALHVRIQVENVSIVPDKDRYTAVFKILKEDKSESRESLIEIESSGRLSQIRWFLRKRCPYCINNVSPAALNGILLAVVLILLLALWITRTAWFWNMKMEPGDPPPATRLGTVCTMMAPIFILLLLLLSPLTRQEAKVYEQTNLYYLMDANSEIWFTMPDKENKGIPDLALQLEETINREVVQEPPGALLGFWQWLRGGYWCNAVFKPRDYQLNRPFLLDAYSFSGDEDTAWLHSRPVETRHPREARLLNPHIALHDAIARTNNNSESRKGASFALLLTGGCAPCRREVEEYLHSLDGIDASSREQLRVFTVLAPSLPTTGDEDFFNYEDGKAYLTSLISDRMLLLNENHDALPQRIAELEKSARNIRKAAFSQNAAANILTFLDPPLFKLANLSSQHRSDWESPSNLQMRRNQALRVEETAIPEACSKIAKEFSRFVKSTEKGRQANSIHVIGKPPLLWLVGLIVILAGFYVFHAQYNSASLGKIMQSRTNHLIHLSEMLSVPAVIASVLLFITWRSEDPRLWTSFGNARWALILGILCWLLWVMAPYVYFAGRKMGVTIRASTWWALVIPVAIGSAVFAFALYQLVLPWTALWLRTVCFGGLCFVPLGLPWLIRCAPQNAPALEIAGAKLDWWQKTFWSWAMKSLLIAALIILARGAFLANPSVEANGLSWLSNRSSYSCFVLMTAGEFALMGAAIAITQKHRRYWLLPLLTSLLCIVLVILSTGG